MHELSDTSLKGALFRAGLLEYVPFGGRQGVEPNHREVQDKINLLRQELRDLGFGIRPIVAPVPLDKLFSVTGGAR